MGQGRVPVAVACGDGIGPEIMAVVLDILKASQAPLEICKVDIGEQVYLKGVATGIEPQTWDLLSRTRAFLKAPITTPQGGGYKSLNVAVRSALGLYANIRPCLSYAPFIETKHPTMDLVIVRENEEDLYTGIEYRQSPQVVHALKLISRPGSEKIVRYAFDYARRYGRRKVTCFVKDNIMKMSDGLFHTVFDEIAQDYPEIEHDHWIVDIGAAKLADTPELFDVVVMPNLYGDILSDVAAQISGSIGLVSSANIGDDGAMFEAIHGSAPRRAGQDLANPSALLLAAVAMLRYLDLSDHATNIENGWLTTIEDGIHTYDIFDDTRSTKKVGTRAFGEAIIERLGSRPQQLGQKTRSEQNRPAAPPVAPPTTTPPPKQELVGVDLYIYSEDPTEKILQKRGDLETTTFTLDSITSRGTQIYPSAIRKRSCIDQYCLRLLANQPPCTLSDLLEMIKQLVDKHDLYLIKTEHLYTFDSRPGFS